MEKLSQKSSVDFLGLILANMSDGVIAFDSQGGMLIFNDAAEEILGKGQIDANPADYHKIYGAYKLDGTPMLWQEDPAFRAIQGETIVDFEMLIRNSIVGEACLSVNAKPLVDGSGAKVGSVCVLRNITRRKALERELQITEEQLNTSRDRERETQLFRQIFDSMPQLGWMTQADGFIDFYNKGWYEYTGTTYEEMQGWGWESVHDPLYLPGVVQKWKEALASGTPCELTFPIRRHDGQYRWFLTRINPMFDETGKLIRWIGVNADIHEQHELKEQLAEQNKRQASIVSVLENSPDFIGMASALDTSLHYLNPAGAKIVGLKEPINLTEKVMQDFVTVDVLSLFERTLSVAAASGYWEGEMTFRNFATNESIPVFQRLWPVLNDKKSIVHFATIATPLSNPQRIDEVLGVLGAQKTLNQELQEALAELQNVAHIVSHELQEPVQAIKSYQNLLAVRYKGRLGDDADEFIEKCATASSAIQLMVDDLWEYARINDSSVWIKSIDCNAILSRAMQILQIPINASGAEIQFENLPEVQGDENLLLNLFVRLLDNAIKYRRNEIPIKIRISGELRERAWVFSIADNGRGIEPMIGKDVFNLFFRGAGRSGADGTGMGLAIAKKIVEHFGGNISFESVVDQGSTFMFTLPRLGS